MNKKTMRDLAILAVVGVVLFAGYQFFSLKKGVVTNETQTGAAPHAGEMPGAGTMGPDTMGPGHGMGTPESALAQKKKQAFEDAIASAATKAKVERFDDYEKTGVAATVDGEKITAEEFKRRLESRKTMMGGSGGHPGAEGGDPEKALLDKMINDIVMRNEAKRLGVAVAKEEVDAILAERKKNFKAPGEFEKLLKQHNFTEQDIRNQIEREMMTQKLMDAITKDVTVTEEEMQEAMGGAAGPAK